MNVVDNGKVNELNAVIYCQEAVIDELKRLVEYAFRSQCTWNEFLDAHPILKD